MGGTPRVSGAVMLDQIRVMEEQLEARIERPGRADLSLSGWPGVPRTELVGLATGIETVLRCAGRSEVKVDWDRRPDGAAFVATWQP